MLDSKLEKCCIPLMMKRYKHGWVTSKLLSKGMKGRVRMSQAMGLGLGLDKIKSGRVVLFAGGTGLYPFVDLIDILFKKTLLDRRLVYPPAIPQLYIKLIIQIITLTKSSKPRPILGS